MDSLRRTAVKASLWALIGFLMMTGTGFVVTGSLPAGGLIAMTNTITGLLSYVVYERIWAGISWGKL